jgi:hypothetical protein
VVKSLKSVSPVSIGIVVSAFARPEWLVEVAAIAVIIPDQGALVSRWRRDTNVIVLDSLFGRSTRLLCTHIEALREI